ncbi:hypothetical protein NUU61_000409 [Penicillium alfredii]|uniref:VOC domain-containing protein n=1 Tax=Penicillium alfredii TaxID=1506179 RepID=A0A9W9GAX3_9EURO|nr:uncharacterized protein NUU61_000409 [Penicillium alfredii]KAJ5114650.1 hypothetical protein NUU61_000409 [Penicillium alfredii]
MPVSHLTLTVSHLPTSTSFFLSCLQPLGYQFIGRHDDYIGFGQKQGEPADFWITEQKPGVPAGAVHVAFPGPSKDAVGAFFISALKAGGKIHGEPKTRDAQSGYFSAAVIDFDGNSIEAVYRPDRSLAPSVASGPTIALIENGSVISKASSKASTIKAESIAPPKSEATSRAVSKAPTAMERAAPSSYAVQAPPKPDDGSKAAKTIVGTLIGAAAGAAIAYAMVKGDSESSSSDTGNPPRQYTAEYPAIKAASQVSQDEQAPQPVYRAIEAPPPRSVYTTSAPRSTVSQSVTSKNPRASTIYEGTEFFHDESGRRASEGSIYTVPEDIPLRAIEYPPPSNASQQRYPCNPSTFISSYAADKPRGVAGSVHSASTIKASRSSLQRRHSHDDRDGSSSSHSLAQSHHSQSHHSHRASMTHPLKSGSITGKDKAGSTDPSLSGKSSHVSARNVPLPSGSTASFYSSRSANPPPSVGGKSHVLARDIPLPGSVVDLDVNSHVTPDDSISQVGSHAGGGRARSTHSHSHSHRSSHSKAASRASKHSSHSKSKFEVPVRPADSISQVSGTSQRTIKAGGSKPTSRVSSRRGSQVV